MSGVKGKSGKVTTEAGRASRRESARKGGLAKRLAGRNSSINTNDGKPPTFAIASWIDFKDKLACDLAERKITQADLEVDKARIEARKASGDLLTIKQVEERDERMDEIIMGHLDDFVQFVGTLVPPEKATEARAKAKEWKSTVCAKIAKDLEESRQ